ncbi:MAG: DnaJ domain-containing protein [Acidobacteria bacterium]|nr:DnaJ domain-containing protein [Acidobacteriota bacterium]
MEYKDYYQILGVPKNADAAAIKKAYRQLARKYHPDMNKDNPQAEARFKDINEAYQVLSDPEKRKKYDQLGANWDKYKNFDFQGQGAPFDFSQFRTYTHSGGASAGRTRFTGFSDFFKAFFGGGGDLFGGAEDLFSRSQGPTTRTRPADLNAELEISIREAMTGAHKQVTIHQENLCPQCGGRGMVSAGICPACSGQGRVRRPEHIDVKIPAGIHNGARLRLRGKGGMAAGGQARGDLYLRIRIRNDSLFRLDGRNIVCEIPVTVFEAVLGAEIEVPTVTGKVKMRIPPETENGKILRLRGKGLPAIGHHLAGDQIVTIRVVLPTNLSAREKELFHELARYRRENPRARM